MKGISRATLAMTVVAIIAMAAALSGCTGTKGDQTSISGKDLFDPAKFSMARYNVTAESGGIVSHSDMIITTAMQDISGDRLTTVEFTENFSLRTDVWINRDRTLSTSVRITDINTSNLQISGGEPTFNMTVADRSWNTLETEYGFVGLRDILTGAGSFTNCTVYENTKKLYYGQSVREIKVDYYIHPSSPVPVKYIVSSPDASYTYELQSVYRQGDHDSTPERVIQSYFESLDSRDFDTASKYLVKYDDSSERFLPINKETYSSFYTNMNETYGDGGDNMKVLYVYTREARPGMPVNGQDVVSVKWASVHYQNKELYAYYLDGHFNVTKTGSNWRIIA